MLCGGFCLIIIRLVISALFLDRVSSPVVGVSLANLACRQNITDDVCER